MVHSLVLTILHALDTGCGLVITLWCIVFGIWSKLMDLIPRTFAGCHLWKKSRFCLVLSPSDPTCSLTSFEVSSRNGKIDELCQHSLGQKDLRVILTDLFCNPCFDSANYAVLYGVHSSFPNYVCWCNAPIRIGSQCKLIGTGAGLAADHFLECVRRPHFNQRSPNAWKPGDPPLSTHCLYLILL